MKIKNVVIIAFAMLCSVCSYAADGFGERATGGKGGQTVTVDGSPAMFASYVESDVPYIVEVKGTIDLGSTGGKVRIRSDKTIRGIGEKPTIVGELGFKNGSSNVIIEKLNITNPHGTGEGDGLSIKEDVTDVFVTQCTVFDCSDGCLDITRRSDRITVSWCRFYFTQPAEKGNRVMLIGNSDNSADDEGTLHITLHHNWFGANCRQRIPSVRYGKVHLYNNYYDCAGNMYGLWSRIKAECLVENNVFSGIKNPYSIHTEDEAAADRGKICSRGNLCEQCTGSTDEGQDAVFTPTYTYTADPAESVAEAVKARAGA
jgi:pectate lyase